MKFGLTQQFDCSYLPDKKEQLLVFVDDQDSSELHYDLLIQSGFRRSGEQIYRPHCIGCNACQSIRIPVADFVPSRSQKRIASKNQDLLIQTSVEDKPEYFQLYASYINTRHTDGGMYPATQQQYDSFIKCHWNSPLFMEFYHEQELIAVAVTDQLDHALSALYTFYHPDFEHRSPGIYAILAQIKQARKMQKTYLYLGYQIDDCAKMRYKRNFYPHERFIDNKWQLIRKKSQ